MQATTGNNSLLSLLNASYVTYNINDVYPRISSQVKVSFGISLNGKSNLALLHSHFSNINYECKFHLCIHLHVDAFTDEIKALDTFDIKIVHNKSYCRKKFIITLSNGNNIDFLFMEYVKYDTKRVYPPPIGILQPVRTFIGTPYGIPEDIMYYITNKHVKLISCYFNDYLIEDQYRFLNKNESKGFINQLYPVIKTILSTM